MILHVINVNFNIVLNVQVKNVLNAILDTITKKKLFFLVKNVLNVVAHYLVVQPVQANLNAPVVLKNII